MNSDALPFLAVMTMLVASSGAVAAQRTFVATTGSDAHPCSLAQPCRGFAAALTHTDPGGEIVVLDSGGYGRVTINHSVTITAPAGVHAGISVFAGTNGIDIPAGGVIVVLRGLAITGQGGNDGIYVSGDNELAIERCDIGGMAGNGIHLDGVAGTVQIRDTVVHDNGANGIFLFGQLSATLDRVQVERNTLTGLYVIEGPQVEAKDARLIRNNRGLEVTTSAAYTYFTGDSVQVIRSNHEGVRAIASAAGSVLIAMVRGEISYNTDGGALVLVTGSEFADATFAENLFIGNGVNIKVDRGVSGGIARANVTRNVFANGLSSEALNNALIQSGGGNAVAPGGAYSPPGGTFSF